MTSIPSIKQNQSLAWFLGPQALEKLITYDVYSSIKQNQSVEWLLGPRVLGKLITYGVHLSSPSYLTEPRPCLVPWIACLG